MLSLGKTVLERKKLECKGFLSYVFKDISFPPECDGRIKIKTLSSIISPFHADNLLFFFKFGLHKLKNKVFRRFEWVIPGRLARSSAPYYDGEDSDEAINETSVEFLNNHKIFRTSSV